MCYTTHFSKKKKKKRHLNRVKLNSISGVHYITMIELKIMLQKIIKITNFPGAKDTSILKQIKMSVSKVHCLIFLAHVLHQYCSQYGQFDFKDACIF